MKSGIYSIVNISDGLTYIGSSNNLRKRHTQHNWDFKNNRHSNNRMQRVYNKYGKDIFKYSVLEYCNPDDRHDIEQQYLDFFLTSIPKIGYNMCPNVGSVSGKKVSDETKKKIGDSNRGKKRTVEQLLVQSETHKGFKCKPESIEKSRMARIGKKPSKESIEKIRAKKLGSRHTEATKKKISMANIGKCRPMKDSTKVKLSLANKGKTLSKEHRDKMSVSHKGKVQTSELIAKRVKSLYKPVLKLLSGECVGRFNSVKEAASSMGCQGAYISKTIKSGGIYKGYNFKHDKK